MIDIDDDDDDDRDVVDGDDDIDDIDDDDDDDLLLPTARLDVLHPSPCPHGEWTIQGGLVTALRYHQLPQVF